MPNVLIFKETILPPSETFILAQMSNLARFTPYLSGLERVPTGLAIDRPALLLSHRASKAADLRAKLYRRTGFAPFFHRQIKRLKLDLVHAHFASGGKTLLPLLATIQRPLIVTLHGGSDVPIQKPRMGVYRQLAEQASLFLCVSEFIRRQALEAGYPEEKLLVHYIGIDRTVFAPSDGRTDTDSVLFVGRLVEMKGAEYVLRAMQAVQAARPQTALNLIGDGPLRPGLERLAGELNVRCRFMGVQPPAVVREMLQKSRLLTLPSLTTADGHVEGLGMVLLEAQAMGIPVVATLHAGIQEAVADGSSGTLVAERNYEELADAMLRLLNDQELWQRYSVGAQQHIAQHFDLHRQTALLEDIYAGQIGR